MKKFLLLPVFLSAVLLSGCSDSTNTKDTSGTAPLKSTTEFTCNCSKTCPNMSCSEAQYQLNSCGCSARDADGDGTACDAQCQ